MNDRLEFVQEIKGLNPYLWSYTIYKSEDYVQNIHICISNFGKLLLNNSYAFSLC